MAKTSRAAITGRFNLRASPAQERLIRAVADRRGVSVTDFILQSACSRAEEVLAEQRHFNLGPEPWKKFMRALDRPPRVKPGLARLLAERTVTEPPE